MNKTPSTSPLPDSVLIGDAEAYLLGIDPAYRVAACTMLLRLIANLRLAHARNGNMLMALAQLEQLLNPTVTSAQAPPSTPPSQYTTPP